MRQTVPIKRQVVLLQRGWRLERTMLRQLTRTDELLPRPLSENSVNVAVALDVVHWRATSHE
jgi:hypothetical protein